MVQRRQREFFNPAGARARERLRVEMEAAATSVRMRRLADTLTTEVSLAERVAALGFQGEAAQVFDLLPLVHVAWADGAIQRGERVAIFDILEARAIAADSPAFRVIETLLEERPSQEYLDESLAVCRDVVGTRSAMAETVLELCVRVAESAGGFMGLGNKVAPEERVLVARIAKQFGPRAMEAFQTRFGAPD